jgi:hypothetical protein
MATILDSFFVALGFENDDTNAEKYEGSLKSLRESALGLIGVFVGAAAAVGGLAISAAESLGAIQDFAELNDVSAAEIHGLSIAGKEYDLTLQGVESTYQGLNVSIGQAALHLGRAGQVFQRVGLQAKNADGSVKSVREVLGDVADKMQDMNAGERLALASRLGIDANFTKILKEGRDAFDDWADSAKSPFNDKQFEQAERIDKLWLKASATFKSLATVIGVALFPAVEDLLRTFLAWWKTAKPEVVQKLTEFFSGLAKVVFTVGSYLFGILAWGYKVVEWLAKMRIVGDAVRVIFAAWVAFKIGGMFTQLVTAIWSAVTAMGAFNVTAMLIPILIGAAVAAVILLADDIYNFVQGHDSLIGRAVKKWPWFATFIDNVRSAVVWLGEGFASIWSNYVLPFIDNATEYFQRLYRDVIAPTAAGIYNMFATALPPLWDLVSTYLGLVYDYWTTVFSAIGAIVSWFFDTFTVSSEQAGNDAVDLGNVLKTTFEIVGFMIKGAALALKAFIDDIKWAIDGLEKLTGMKATDQERGETAAAMRNRSTELANMLTQASQLAGLPPGAAAPVGGNTNTFKNATTVNDTKNWNSITVVTPDPKTAGDHIAATLDRLHKKTTRNGQSPVQQ